MINWFWSNSGVKICGFLGGVCVEIKVKVKVNVRSDL